MEILVNVIGQKLKIATNLKCFISGSQQFVKFIFNMDSSWDNLRTFAQFRQNGVPYNQYLNEDNSVYLPSEISAGSCTLILYGTGNDIRATTNYLTLTIDENILVSDAQSTEITQSLYQQLVNNVEVYVNKVDTLASIIHSMAGDSPIVVDDISDMTDINKIYVLSTDGAWYYHNGTTWNVGGFYGAISTDRTLSEDGIPADAKAVGDIAGNFAKNLTNIHDNVSDLRNTIISCTYSENISGESVLLEDSAGASLLSMLIDFSAKQSGDNAPSPDNIRPISGYNGVKITIENEENSLKKTIDISFGDTETIYSGTLNVVTGEITVKTAFYEFTGNESFYTEGTWVTTSLLPDMGTDGVGAGICSHYPYRSYYRGHVGIYGRQGIFDGDIRTASEWKTFCTEQYNNGTPVQVVYPLKTPKVYSISQHIIPTFTGKNTITTDMVGQIELNYVKDIKTIIHNIQTNVDKKTNWVTPEMFGAVGDGVTDDSLAITSAITAAGINGKIILGEKTYYVGTALFTLLEGQTLTGGGTLYQNSEVDGKLITTANNVVIDGINIKQDVYHTGIGILVSGDNVSVRNCNVIGKKIGIHGDNVYGDNLIIESNRITFTMYGVYVSVGRTERRRTGLRIVNNVISLSDGYDANLNPALNKSLNIGGCSGALVQGNILLGAAMAFASYLWSDHIIYSDNISDNYVSMIGDYCVVSNNVIDGSLRPEIYFPVSSVGMLCAVEIVGNECVVDGNIINNNEGPAVSSNNSSELPMRGGLIISNNSIKACAKNVGSQSAINIIGVKNVKITNNTLFDCGDSTKRYSAIYIQGFKFRNVSSIDISNNTLRYCKNTDDSGAVNIQYANDVKIISNYIESVGRCFNLAPDGQLITNCVIENNTIISGATGRIGLNDMFYLNEFILRGNDLVRAINGQSTYSISRNCKNYNNDGLMANTPTRGTFNMGEIYPTTYALKRCTASGTLGITTFSAVYIGSVIASTTSGSAEITVNDIGGVALCEGQYIDIQGAVNGAKIISIDRVVDDLEFIKSATITLSSEASATVSDATVTYHSPTFIDI